jgi:hypothetical protein
MLRSRIFAPCVNLSIAAAIFAVGPLTDAAAAAARRAAKPVRRTASAPNNAGLSSPMSASAAGAASDGATPSNDSAAATSAVAADDRQKEGAAARRNRESDARERERRVKEPPPGGARDSDAPRDGVQAKGADKASPPDPARASPGPSGPSAARSAANVRAAAAKAPADAPSVAKSTSEKFASDRMSESADSSRASVEASGSNARRDPSQTTASSGRPIVVNMEGPFFDGGDVPRAAAALDRMKASFGRCVAGDGALTKNEGTVDLRFLVRAPGRAEGVDVDKVRGLSVDVVRCMTSVLARSYVGAPSDDPVGVAITLRVRRPEAGNN